VRRLQVGSLFASTRQGAFLPASVRLLFSHFLNQCGWRGLRAYGDAVVPVNGEWTCVAAVLQRSGGGEGLDPG